MTPPAPTFTYGYGSNPVIDYPRLLVSDTQQFAPNGTLSYVFADQEILAMEAIVQGQFQSGMFYSTPGGPPNGGTTGNYALPNIPIPYYRVAGMLLMSIASNKSRLASVMQLLDVKLDPSKAASALRETAQAYLDQDDNSGAFVIIEQVNDPASFRDRFWKQWQRQSGYF